MVIAQECISRLFLTVNYPFHKVLHCTQTVYGESRTNSKNDIAGQRKQFTIKPKELTDEPFNPVAPHRIAGFPVHTDSQSIVRLRVRQINHGEILTSESLAKPVNALKLPGRLEQMNFRKSKTVHLLRQITVCALSPFFS